jgi:hypothetical protein
MNRFPFMARARRTKRTPGQMNKLEESYSRELDVRKRAGEIQWFAWEGVKLRLADRTFLTPDFAVINAASELEFHECKGFMEDDAAVKLKVAADRFPFRFVLVRARAKKHGGGFEIEEV